LEAVIRRKKTSGEKTSFARVVDFASVARNRPQYEVCRLFLASLSLSNSGNILPVQSDDDNSGNHLKLHLLNTAIDRPMDTYLAPSVCVIAP
jgi:condensin-2 complex subunit H2